MNCNCYSDECFHGDKENYSGLYGACEMCGTPMNEDYVCESCTEGFDALRVAGVAEVERLVRL